MNSEKKKSTPEDSEEFLVHSMTPSNVGVLSRPDGHAHPSGPCGDSIEVFLRVEQGRVAQCVFLADGCAHTIACGSVATTLAQGRAVEGALAITAEEIGARLGGLAPEHEHCARLAASSLRLALKDYLSRAGAN